MPCRRQPENGQSNTPTAADALQLLGRLDDAEQRQLLAHIIHDQTAPLHDHIDLLLKTMLHGMKASVYAYASFRDRMPSGGRLWGSISLQRIKKENGWSWPELYRRVVELPDGIVAVKLVCKGYQHGPLTSKQEESVRKAIRDLDRHDAKGNSKAERMYRLIVEQLPPELIRAFPGIESYLRR